MLSEIPNINTNWWLLSEKEISHTLNTDSAHGLHADEAHKRLQEFGLNQLFEQPPTSAFRLFLNQFSNVIIWILIGAATIAGFLHDWVDALAILVIVILNTFLGFIQEYRAVISIAALRKLASPTSKVIRDQKLMTLPSKHIVPGDLVLIEAGDRIPADGRFVRTFGLSTQESALTGESMPVHKTAEKLETGDFSIGDKKNMGFQGTLAISGKGYLIATETGLKTELGKISSLLQQGEEEQTPLQKRLHELGLHLVAICLGIVILVFLWGYIKGAPLVENLLIAISLAVAAIPEGLPAIVTIALSYGVHKMAKRNALVRRLSSVETLGCTTIICTDKTGTLTQNEMTVRSIFINNTFVEVTGTGYRPEGNFEINHANISPEQAPGLLMLLKIGVLCNGAELHHSPPRTDNWNITGDPTEGALLTAAGKVNFFKHALEKENPLVSEIPFDSDRKRMSMVRQTPDGRVLFIKGAPDIILDHSVSILLDGKVEPLTAERRKSVSEANAFLASQALRVIAVGYRPLSQNENIDHTIEENIILVGLIAMMDPPRPEVKKSIETCTKAGITTIMITGDHKDTATAVAKELNLLKADSIILTGTELDHLDENSLKQQIRRVAIYARTSAANKLRIVRAWKSLGEVVAMTGDGVNDAPALKEANIGIAMGITGADISKEASDMVISDDNFASIVSAVEEGRGIYDNITKFVGYLLSSNIAELMVVFVGMLLGFTDLSGNPFVPLSALQILWINLASDGLPAIALGLDPLDPKAMERAPRKTTNTIITRKHMLYLVSISLVIAAGALTACYFGMQHSKELAQTMTFTTLVVLELVAVQIIRSPYNISIFSNPYIIMAVAISFILQLLIVYNQFLQRVFNTVPLNMNDWGIISAITIVVWALCTLVNRLFKDQSLNRKLRE